MRLPPGRCQFHNRERRDVFPWSESTKDSVPAK
jgi:hypothetical protein